MEERAGPETHGRRSNHSAELPAIAVKQELNDEEEEKRNEENGQIFELRKLLEQAEERARVAKQEAVSASADMVEWMEKAAEYEEDRIIAENSLTKQLAEAKTEAEKIIAEKKELAQRTQVAIDDAQRLRVDLEAAKVTLHDSIAALAKSEESLNASRFIVESQKRAMKELAIRAAQKTTPDFTPSALAPGPSENAADDQSLREELKQVMAELVDAKDSLEVSRKLTTELQGTLKDMEIQLKEALRRNEEAKNFAELEVKQQELENGIMALQKVMDEGKIREGRLESERDLLKSQLEKALQTGGTSELTRKLDELVQNNRELHREMGELRTKAARYEDAAHTVTTLERENADLRNERRRERNRADRNDDEKRIIKLEKDNADLHDRCKKLVRKLERGNQETVAKRKKNDHHHDRSRSPPARSSRTDDDDDHNQKRIDDLREIIKKLEEEAIDAQVTNARLESDRNEFRANLRNKAKVDDEKLFELTNEVERLQSALFHKESVILDMRKRIDEEQSHVKERNSMMQRIEQMTNQMQEMHERHDKALAESAAALQRLKDAYQQLSDDHDEAKEKLILLSSTSSRQLQDELTQARKKIEQLESALQELTSKIEKDEETRRKRARFEKDVDEEPVAPAPPFILQQSAFGGASGSFVSPTANEQRWKRGGFQPLGRKDTSHTSAQKNPSTNGTTAQSAAFLPRTLR